MPRSRSIRSTLTLQMTVLLLVVMTLFSALVLQKFQEIIYADTDTLLKSKVEGLEHSINVYWELYDRTAITEQNFTQAVKEWIRTSNVSPLLTGLIVRIYRPDGSLIASNRKDLDERVISREIIRQLRKDKFLFENVGNKNFIGFEVRIESLLTYVKTRSQDYIIQTALENRKIEEPLSRLQVVILILLPLFLIVGAGAVWLMIRHSLLSIGYFVQGLRQTQGGPRTQFDPEDFPDQETRTLSLSFNALMTRIEESFNQQRRVFEDLSHQMKTPLAVMRGELEIALKKPRAVTDYQEILTSSLEEVERMASIVENLLKLARFDAQEVALTLTRFTLAPCLTTLIRPLEKLADSRGVELVLVCPSDLSLTADQFKIEQALLNLVDNAIKYARSGTAVTVTAAAVDDGVTLRIHDFGAVIPPDELPQVFERFWRSQSTMREKGFGLGLAIVKELIEMQSGRVRVSSTETEGTTFTVWLPQPLEAD